MTAPTIHGTAIAIGEEGVLIRGPSGAGKSILALRFILDAPRALPAAELVADDRVRLFPEGTGLAASAPPEIAGLLEVRGIGLRRLPYRPSVRLGLVVDLKAGDAARLPDEAARFAVIDGVRIPRIAPLDLDSAALALAAALLTAPYEG